MLLQGDDEALTRTLNAALAWAAADVLALRSEQEILDTVADVLRWNGLQALVLLQDGDAFRAGPLRIDTERALALEARFGAPLQVRGPVAEALRAQLAARERVRAVRRPLEVGPDAFAAAVATLRAEPGEAALLIVDGARFTPATLRAVEELARFTGAALDNLREKQRLVAKLSALRQAQQNLLAEERLSVLGEAAAILAHEIRNPLGAVANGLSLLRRSTPEQEGLLGIMGDEIARLDALTHDLLQLARPLEPRRQLVDLERLVRATVERLRAGRDDVRYLVDARARVRVHADPALLQLALENLLRNAAQASPARGEVRIIVSDASGATSVVVEDQGPGIDAVDRLRIFEPFFTTRASGTGLGLPIVKRIVQAHGGEVRVGGGAGGGARFEMLLSAHLE